MKRVSLRLGVAVAAALSLSTACAQTRVWNGLGGDDNWSTADNWGGTLPVAGNALTFGGTARCTNLNDLAEDTSFAGITFASGSALFSLAGNRITLGGNVVNNDNDSHRINLDMILDAPRTFNMAGGSVYANGALSGSGGVTVSGGNILVLAGTNTYQGATSVTGSGILRILSDSALGSADAGTTVASGARLELAGGVTVTGEAVTINGNGGNNNGALQVQAGSNTWAGRILLGTTGARLGVTPSNAMLVVTGVIDDGPNTYALAVRCADSGGPVVLANTNAYKGETQVVVGKLMLSGGDDRLPTNTVVRMGNSSNTGYATLDLNGQNQTVAGITQDGSTMTRRITNASTSTVSTLTVNTRNPYTFSAMLSGNLNLDKTGTNTLTLSAPINDFYGQTRVREGTLALVGQWALQDSTFNTGDAPMGVLSFGTNTVINFGGLIGSNDLVMTNSAGAAVALRIRGAQSTAFDGQIVGGSDFTKVGTGTFTLKKAASYPGRTYLLNGNLVIPTEDVLGVYPEAYVADQIVFDGGTLKASSNFVFGASNRGVTLAAGGGAFDEADVASLFTVAKTLSGPGGVSKKGPGVVMLACSNAYDGVTTVAESILRVVDNHALGSAAGGTAVNNSGQLELANGVTVSGENLSISGSGITTGTTPPSAPQFNRGALQAGVNATAEWAGPVFLSANGARVGAQEGGHLIISGAIGDGGANRALQTSSSPNYRSRGTLLKGQNTYGGGTDITRGTLFLGAANTLPAGSVLDVHWSNANNQELACLDLNGFDQTVGGLKNTGVSDGNALVTNSSPLAVTLTVNQTLSTEFAGVLAGNFALAKGGPGTLTLTNRNWYSGSTTVGGGTLRTAVDNALPTNTALALAGGTFDVGTRTNAVASLTVTANSTLALGTGKLTVTAQTADAWTGQLNLTGTLGATSLRFQPALSPDQLGRIRYDGTQRVALNADGYARIVRGTLLRVQ